ncbi:MAG: hypothetical protein DMG05_21065 [Acidobacteria bacterium]|nr:MAG: hypothetical protein DMG05_21065 [Acidobacteriota bacterium]
MPRGYQAFLTCCFLLIVLSVPIAQAVNEIWRGQWPQTLELFRQVPTKENLRAFEKGLEDSSSFAQTLRGWMQYLCFKLLKEPGEKVLLGRDGWLFYKPDVRYLVERYQTSSPAEDPFSAILAFRDQLALRGIHLMVIPIPGKPSIYPDRLTRRVAATERSVPLYTLELIDRLRGAGVEIVNLFEAFRALREKEPIAEASYYLPQDTHWSGIAARIAAEVVAQKVLDLGWIDPGGEEYDQKPVSVKRRGDIIRMVRVPEIERRFPAETLLCYQVIRRASGELYKDDPASPVLVLGDSFLRIYQTDEPTAAGFIAHLARKLKRPLASVVNDGGASTLVRQELSRRAYLLRGKKVVIWEFVERDIRFGTEGWKYVLLPGGFEHLRTKESINH